MVDVGKNLKSSIPVVKATTRQRSAIRNFATLSFLVSGQYFKDYHRIQETLGLDHVSSTQWIHILMDCTVRKKDRRLERARSKN